MATLKEAQTFNTTGFSSVVQPVAPPIPIRFDEGFNPMLRCPLPPSPITPDSLRQFYLNGHVPQMRLIAPANPSLSTSVVTNKTTVVSTSTGTGTSTAAATSLSAKQVSITTNSIVPNGNFIGSLAVAKAFQLLAISANVSCRIRLYGTAVAQSLDLGRALDAAPPAGTTSGMIMDVALDTLPLQWPFENSIGGNNDSPQSSTVYITVTNLSSGSAPITVTLSCVPLVA